MKRLFLCASCVISVAAVAVAVVMAIGIEAAQREKQRETTETTRLHPRVYTYDSTSPPDEEWFQETRREWREALGGKDLSRRAT